MILENAGTAATSCLCCRVVGLLQWAPSHAFAVFWADLLQYRQDFVVERDLGRCGLGQWRSKAKTGSATAWFRKNASGHACEDRTLQGDILAYGESVAGADRQEHRRLSTHERPRATSVRIESGPWPICAMIQSSLRSNVLKCCLIACSASS